MKTGSRGMNENGGDTGYVYRICLVAALGGLLFGYDTAVISGAIGFLQEHFDLSPFWKGWAASSALIGCLIGVVIGMFSDILGRKKVLVISAVLFLISALGTALPRTLTEFILFRVLGGIGVGAASMTSPLYIAEISPTRIRGRMVSINQFAIIFGMLVVYFVNYGIAEGQVTEWNRTIGWRWMFGSEAIPAVILLGCLFFVPESPRWLVTKGRTDEALATLNRVNGNVVAKKEFQDIREAIAHEPHSLRSILKPEFTHVLMIGIVLAVLQQVTGINVFLYYAPEIFKGLGTEVNTALLQTIVVGSVNLLFTVIAIWTVDLVGRKPLMLIGSTGMGLSLFALGGAAYAGSTAIWVLVFVLTYIASFALSVGPVVWVILSEIFPTRIRARAMAIATFFLWGANFVVSQTFPMIDENPWLVEKFNHAASFWIYGLMCVVTLWFVYYYVPETKGRSLEEIEEELGMTEKIS